MKQVVAEMIGARMKTTLSTALGRMSSFSASFTPSASDCSRPNGPVRFGPGRDCIRPTTRRSAQIMIRVVTTRKTKTTSALPSTTQPLSWLKSAVGFSAAISPPMIMLVPLRRT